MSNRRDSEEISVAEHADEVVDEDDVVIGLDVKNSGGPSLVHGITHRAQSAQRRGTNEEVISMENIEDVAEIVALSRKSWGYDPQMFKCPYCKAEDYSANHLEHTPFVWAGEPS